ncbi:hypothetical protein NEMIN01_1728 [Nematocida minor]|uniref:uncharacterized protein n=1 Tax=Nematocida minor TaxID=1912983 RepID=UPI00221F812B|nr:uncharacterized protein NEMIN01_1728 [Nematocida minor]KAI5191910.1 hypothetical protein NEMIN01_1728 [Nematocida minor]
MVDPDAIFEEPWGAQAQQERDSLTAFIAQTESAWRRAKRGLPRLAESLETMHRASKEMGAIKDSMENAKEEILKIENMTGSTEREIRTKKKALEILEEITKSIKITKEEIQVLEEPIFTDMQEVANIEEALEKVRKCLAIENPRILSMKIVADQQSVVRRVSARFQKKAKEFIQRDCLKNKKVPTEVHTLLSRYSEIVRYLVENGEFQECMHAYTVTMSKLHRNYISKKIEEIVHPFKKSKNKPSLNGKIEEAIISIIQLLFSLASTEGYFLSELFNVKDKDLSSSANVKSLGQNSSLKEIFAQTEQELILLPKMFYDLSYEAGILNILSSKISWLPEANTPSEEMAGSMVGSIIPKMKKEMHGIMSSYLQKIKKIISKEYAKEGPIDLDKTFYNIVDSSKVPSLNTEVLRMNLAHSGKLKTHTERVFQTVKRACILGSIQAHYLENRDIYEAEVEELLNSEIEKMTNNLMYLSEEKVFEKPKLSSIVKRTKEIMDILNKVEDPLGFRLQIAFKDMILSKAHFHQRNEIAAVLTENTKEENR